MLIWVKLRAGWHLDNTDTFVSTCYVLCFVQSTTTGYGDFTPRNKAEQVMVNIYMILGMVMFGLLVGTIANALTKASGEANQLYKFRRKVLQVSKWLSENQVPDHTRKVVQVGGCRGACMGKRYVLFELVVDHMSVILP